MLYLRSILLAREGRVVGFNIEIPFPNISQKKPWPPGGYNIQCHTAPETDERAQAKQVRSSLLNVREKKDLLRTSRPLNEISRKQPGTLPI